MVDWDHFREMLDRSCDLYSYQEGFVAAGVMMRYRVELLDTQRRKEVNLNRHSAHFSKSKQEVKEYET